MKTEEISYYLKGITGGDRRILARAITLIESTLPADQKMALELVDKILPHTGNSVRLGITGVPGVGKSTFIEALGLWLIESGYRVAVLAVDPSSSLSRGSILGDKTRMEQLVGKKDAFIRPSPSAGTLGGVGLKTRETMLLCEAAGYNAVLVETVGVGQSETAVASMVDFFLVLMLAGAGDELQGIKKGIMEHADCIAINKADGDNLKKAEQARVEYERAFHFFAPVSPAWTPVVTTCSAIEKRGIEKIWGRVLDHHAILTRNGILEKKRKKQTLEWLKGLIDEEIRQRFYNDPLIKKKLPDIVRRVEKGQLSPGSALKNLF